MSKFDAISVREKSGVDICKNEFGVEATHVLDPVFLCDMDSYNEILSLSNVKEHKEYLFSYILDPTEDKIEMVKQTAKNLGLPYRIAIDENYDVGCLCIPCLYYSDTYCQFPYYFRLS